MKTTNTKASSQGSVMVIGLLVTILLLVTAGIFVYKHQQHTQAVAKERAEYAQAEKDLDNLTSQIVAKFGKPAEQKKVDSCGYTSNPNEFEKGDLYCGMVVSITYQIESLPSAVSLTDQVSVYIGDSQIFKTGTSSTIFAHDNSPPPTELLSQDISDKTSLDCSTAYTYYLDSNRLQGHSELPTVKSEGLQISISCGSRPAKATYFPIKNS